jgi:hypothetical protein
MSTELAKIEIQEKDLELIVSEKTLGHLTTNARQIKSMVEQALPRYDIVNYNESNIDLAKKDKSILNNAAKVLNAKRLEIEKEWMKPFGEFKDVVSDTVKLISECSAKIDTVVQRSDEKERQEKRETIRRYWESEQFNLVTFEKIFDSKWLNKTEKMKNICGEIDAKIVKINDDITTLEAIGEDVELLKSLYLDTLNINNAIQYANTLKQNKERAKKDEEEKQARLFREKAKARQNTLLLIGLKYNGEEFCYHDINFHHTELITMTDEEFNSAVKNIKERKAEIDLTEAIKNANNDDTSDIITRGVICQAEREKEHVNNSQTVNPSPELQFDNNIPYAESAPVKTQEVLLTRAFKVTTTRENIIALGNFMNEKGIDFEKIEL